MTWTGELGTRTDYENIEYKKFGRSGTLIPTSKHFLLNP